MSPARILTLVWSLWIVTLVALAFVLWVTTAQAHGPGRPDLFGTSTISGDMNFTWHNRGIVGADGKSVPYGDSCDLAELLASSRDLHTAAFSHLRTDDGFVLQRWRRAVESCK